MNEELEMKLEQGISTAASSTQLDPPSAAGDQNNSPELQVSFSSNSTGTIHLIKKIELFH